MRLPGKALVDLAGRPLLGRVLDRCRLVKNAEKIIIATTERSKDIPIVRFAKSESVEVFCGSLHDVAKRAYDCAVSSGITHFARVCGDRPFLDPTLIEEYWRLMQAGDADLVTNVPSRTYPPGMATELVRTESLKRVLSLNPNDLDREHLTRFFYTNRELFRIVSLNSSFDWTDVMLAVDTQRDVERANFIFENIGQNAESTDIEVIAAKAREWQRMQASR